MSAGAPSGSHWLCPSCDAEPANGQRDPVCTACGARLIEVRTTAKDLTGQIIDGRFEIRDLLGEGGMGSVYRAWQRSIGREVAIKLIDERHGRDPMAVRRFLREARLASQLSQPNTVSVFDFGQSSDGRLFIAMELIRGRTLAEVLEVEGPFSAGRAAWIGVQLCDALDAAHRLKIVHRDLKPANVVLLDDPPGRDLIKVLDFGLAKSLTESETKATDTGLVVGTPRYMAPEVVMGEAPTPQSDLYAVGVILGELSTGKVLWDATSFPALAGQKMHVSPMLHEIPAGLRPVVSRLIDPEAGRRPVNASEVRGLLRPLVSNVETPVPFTGPARALSDGGAAAGKRLPGITTEPTVPVIEIATPPPRAPIAATSSTAATVANPTPSRPLPATGADSASASAVQPAAGRRGALIALGAAVVLALAVVVGFAVTRGGDAPEPLPPPPAAIVDASVIVPAETVDAGPPPIDAAPVKMVSLTIRSKPRGATVLIDGLVAGNTPFTTEVPASTTAVVVEVIADGRAARQTVVPDRDRTVTLTIRRSPGGDDLPF